MANRSGVNLNKNRWYANWVNEMGIKKKVAFNINKFGYEGAKQLAIAKQLEMELSLNHYRLALHGLLPLEPNNEPGELEPDVPEEPGEI